MASISQGYNPTQDNEEENSNTPQNSNNYSVSGPDSGSGNAGGAPSSTGGGSASQNQSNPTGTKSGSFTNLSNYLNANSGYNSQGGGLGGQIAQNLSNQGTQLQNNIGGALTNFNNQSQQGYTQDTSGLMGQINSNLSSAGNIANNANQYNQYQSLLNDKYTGPTGLDTTGQLNQQLQNYQNLANQTGSENGRYSLLNTLYAQPGYSSGQQNLDNLLLQADPSQLTSLQAQSQSLSNLAGSNLNSAVNQAQSTAQQNTQNANNIATNALSTLNNAANNLYNPNDPNSQVEQEITNSSAQKAGQLQAAQTAAQNDQVNQTDYNTITQALSANGYNPTSLYNTQLQNYLDPTTMQATAANAASAQDYNTAQGLSKLLGTKAAGDVQSNLGQFGNASQAGTYEAAPSYSVDTTGLMQYLYGGGSGSTNSPQYGVVPAYQNAQSMEQGQQGQATTALGAQYGNTGYTLSQLAGMINSGNNNQVQQALNKNDINLSPNGQYAGYSPLSIPGESQANQNNDQIQSILSSYNTNEAKQTAAQAALANLSNTMDPNAILQLIGSQSANPGTVTPSSNSGVQ